MFEFYFAYKNILNYEYYRNSERSGKDYETNVDREKQINISEDIEQRNIAIKKGDYVLSFDDSKLSSVGQIKDFYLHIRPHFGCPICFDTDNSLPQNSGVNIIVKTKNDITKIAERVELQKGTISKKQIFKKIESQFQYTEQPKITDLLALNKEFLFVKGTFFYVIDKINMCGYEHPYFGMLWENEENILIKEFHELLQVLLIDGQYYIVTYWEKAESGGRGLIIYKLEKNVLIKVFSDHSDAT